jgi:hypothetical protein
VVVAKFYQHKAEALVEHYCVPYHPLSPAALAMEKAIGLAVYFDSYNKQNSKFSIF